MTDLVAYDNVVQVHERPVGLDDVQLHMVDSVDEAMNLMTWLGERRSLNALAFDTETTGLSPEKDRVRLLQIGDDKHGWAIPRDNWGGVFQEAVKKWDGYLLAHNAKFDTSMLETNGIVDLPRGKVLDTRVMAHVLHPTFSTALKNLAGRYVDPRAKAAQTDLDDAVKRLGWAGVPVDFPPYWIYGALDPVLTYQLAQELLPRVMAEAPVAFELENSVSWVVERMERNGTHVDVEYAREHYEKFTTYCAQVEFWCKTEYNVAPGSNAAIIQLLQAAGFTFSKATTSGAVALDKEVLEGIDHPLAQAVLKRRQLQKLATTYLRHYMLEADTNGNIHPSINVLGARTSRMSMQNPNFQNLPRVSETNKSATVIRNCVNSRYGDVGSLIMCDFDQIEMRMLAHMSDDTGLRDAFLQPEDFFVTLAREVFQDDTITKKHPLRQRVKNVGYATIFGAGPRKLASTAGIPERESRHVLEAFNGRYAGQARWRELIMREALAAQRDEGEAYVRCPLTNRKHVADVRKEYALVNFLIQGASAATFKRKLLELDAAGLGDYMVAPVHDEIILDVPAHARADVIDTLKAIMNDSTMLSVPVTAGISEGARWGDKQEIL